MELHAFRTIIAAPVAPDVDRQPKWSSTARPNLRVPRRPGKAAGNHPVGLGRLSARRVDVRGLLLAGCLAVFSTGAKAADYVAETLGTYLQDPSDLVLENPRILSETTLSDGRILLEVAADPRNLAETTWRAAQATVRQQVATTTVDLLTSIAQFNSLSLPGQVLQSATNLFTLVAQPDLAVAKAEVLAGSVFRILAEEAGSGITTLATNLALESTQVLSETPMTNGLVLLEIATSVRNLGPAVYSNVTVNLDSALGTVPFAPPLGSSTYGSLLGPFAATTNMGALYFAVHSNALVAVRSNVLAGAALSRSGIELWVFGAPPKGIDQATEEAWRPPVESVGGGEYRLVFTNITSFLQALQPGDLLVEDPSVNTLPTESLGTGGTGTNGLLANWLPFQVSNVNLLSNEVEVVGQRKTLRQVVKSGTFIADALDAYDHPVRDPYNPTLENTYTHAEETNRANVAEQIIAQFGPRDGRLADLKGMTAIPWHFNDTFLSDKVKVSGELLFRQSGVKIEIKIRDFELQRAAARIESAAVLNLVLEVVGKEDTTDKPDDQKSKNLIPGEALPSISFSLGGVPMTVQPVLSLTAGVEANIPTSLTLPLQSVFVVGFEMGFDRSLVNATNKGFFSQPYTEFIPMRVSDPSVFDDLAASVVPWVELGVGLKMGVGNEAVALEAGPSLAVRLGTEFKLAPLSNPWWSVDAGVDLIGRFTMDLSILGFDPVELVNTEASLHHFDLYHLDAGGPILGQILPMDASRRSPADVRPLSGQVARWGRLLIPGGWGGFSSGFVLTPANSTDLIVGGVGTLARFDHKGALLWAKNLSSFVNPSRAVALPDGSFTVVGTSFNDLWLSNHSGEGDRNWSVTLRVPDALTPRDLVLGQNSQGAAEYYLVGHVQRGLVTRSDPEIIKFDAAGQVLWAKSYDLADEDDEAHGATITADGNLVVSGTTGHPVDPPPVGTPDPANVLKTGCGLLMKVSGADGSLLWANAFPSHWGLDFKRVLEAPDGTLFAAGAAGRIVTQDRPSNLFAKFRPDGSLIDHVTIAEDLDWTNELAHAGNTPYDNVSGFIWTAEGLWACGTTGLGADTAGWVMGLTEELGARFYAVFDGPMADNLLDLVDSGNGLAILGNTYSSYPWGVGGLPVPFLMKLPWEGIMRFHPDSGFGGLYLQPRVYHSSADPEYIVFSHLEIPGAGTQTFANPSGPVPFAVSPVAVAAGTPLPAPVAMTNYATFALDYADPASVQDFASWADFHQLHGTDADPTADPDGDGVVNYLEAYFGRNPWTPETDAVFDLSIAETNGLPTTLLQYDRATFARSLGVRIESSEDLLTWSPAADLTETVQSLSEVLERVSLSTSQAGSQRFFRAIAELGAGARGPVSPAKL